jgi:hypothetical protein
LALIGSTFLEGAQINAKSVDNDTPAPDVHQYDQSVIAVLTGASPVYRTWAILNRGAACLERRRKAMDARQKAGHDGGETESTKHAKMRYAIRLKVPE